MDADRNVGYPPPEGEREGECQSEAPTILSLSLSLSGSTGGLVGWAAGWRAMRFVDAMAMRRELWSFRPSPRVSLSPRGCADVNTCLAET